MTQEPKVAIRFSDPRLGVSLLAALGRFGQRSLATDERVVALPGPACRNDA